MPTRRKLIAALGTAAATLSLGSAATAAASPPRPSLYSNSVLEKLRLTDQTLVLNFKDNPLVGDYGGADLRSDAAELDIYHVRSSDDEVVLKGSYTPGDTVAKHPLPTNENGRVEPGVYRLVLSATLTSKNARGSQKTISEVIKFEVTDYNGLEQTVTLESQDVVVESN